ncbi:MAG: trypsin-like peptidase domain-containing protein [Ardenticatenales bacterium]|nr:trypsin-like peptidase domain-containing protein [Ardenticatenales bacterium]
MSDILQQLSVGMAGAVETAGPSVVRVEARRRLPATGIVWSADGLIVTANHIVRRDDKIKVGLADGNTVEAELVGRDPTTDLAVLRVSDVALTPLKPADLDKAAVGNLVLALGRPGRTVQATLGIISALGDQWRTPHGGELDRYLQTDVVMYPGFSGGPLLSANGELLGLNSSTLVNGLSLAVPAGTLARVVDTLATHGRVRRGYLGVSTQQVALPAALREQMGQKHGLLVVAVEPDSPADKGGLLLGDTIVQFADQAVGDHQALLALLSGDRVGQESGVHVIRGGEVTKLKVVLGER